MERPAILNRSMPSEVGAIIGISPARAPYGASNSRFVSRRTCAIYTFQKQYTRSRAVFPGTCILMLTFHAEVLTFPLKSGSGFSQFTMQRGALAWSPDQVKLLSLKEEPIICVACLHMSKYCRTESCMNLAVTEQKARVSRQSIAPRINAYPVPCSL
jgi:hypothetical protein